MWLLSYRDLDYQIQILAQGHSGMLVMNPGRKVTYTIFQSRVYHLNIPRQIVIGLNPIRKEFKLSASRPEYQNPLVKDFQLSK